MSGAVLIAEAGPAPDGDSSDAAARLKRAVPPLRLRSTWTGIPR